MAKRTHLPVLIGGQKYEGWMPFCDDEPIFVAGQYSQPNCAEIYATRKDAASVAEDVRRVTIIVEPQTKRPVASKRGRIG